MEQGIDRGLSGKHHVEADTAQAKAEVHALVREIEDRTRHVDVDVDVDRDRLGRTATQISSSLMDAANAGRSCDEHDGVQRALQQPSKRCRAHRHQLPCRRAGRTGRCRRSSHRSARPAAGCPHRRREHCRRLLAQECALYGRAECDDGAEVQAAPTERDEQGLTALAR